MRGAARAGAALRLALRLTVVVAVAYAAHRLMGWAEVQSDLKPGRDGALMVYGVLLLVYLTYAILLAIPFVPGIEIGLVILMMQGPAAVVPIYLSTIAGLVLAYGAGHWLPDGWLRGLLADLGLTRAAGLLERVGALSPAERLELLRSRLPSRLGRVAVGWRYLWLALLLNLPGNWILGGGGGILLVAGLSGLFRPLPTALTLALAVAPVPLLVWSFGLEII